MKAAPHNGIIRAIHARVLVLDGATGTMLREAAAAAHMPLSDLLCLRPGTNNAVTSLHRAYLDAGADIIRTNTFNANATTLQRLYAAEDANRIAIEINRIATRTALQCTHNATANDGRPRYVAGVVSPLRIKDNDDRHKCEEACKAQMQALAENGADILLAESCYDLPGTRIAAQVAAETAGRYGIHTMFSATVNGSGTLPTGGTIEDFIEAIAVACPIAAGLNCCEGPGNFVPILRLFKSLSPYPAIAYPSAGLPGNNGWHTATPGEFGQMAHTITSDKLAQILGGCCGTTPAHIAAIAQAVADKAV